MMNNDQILNKPTKNSLAESISSGSHSAICGGALISVSGRQVHLLREMVL